MLKETVDFELCHLNKGREKFSGNDYSLIENKELRFERSGLWIEVEGEAKSLELVKN